MFYINSQQLQLVSKLIVFISFQSMGICFIGERNFESFILEVRIKTIFAVSLNSWQFWLVICIFPLLLVK